MQAQWITALSLKRGVKHLFVCKAGLGAPLMAMNVGEKQAARNRGRLAGLPCTL